MKIVTLGDIWDIALGLVVFIMIAMILIGAWANMKQTTSIEEYQAWSEYSGRTDVSQEEYIILRRAGIIGY